VRSIQLDSLQARAKGDRTRESAYDAAQAY
jgi:hypothetical protein